MTTTRQNTRETNATIRAATLSDRDFAIEILKLNKLPTNGIQSKLTGLFVIAETADDRTPIGVAALEIYGELGLLRSLAVSKNWQGLGIGRKLVEDRIGWARNKNLKELFLLTTTAPDFFKQFGFEKLKREYIPEAVKQSGEFLSDCPESTTAMSMAL